ncbi:hypothetical protein [Pseudosporangium ferrugineum]|uniref:Uncharacterized protein n=1 Tax=Pseudosporangium ferrugineum TaxID=439699 RepID=A0A2T0SES7_9ACTN|nr:hypothetical protein [Pseudosporangium ferrugineum]PRY31914.1 hypothetical protein CLV70_102125 [Pseudosporangium ferrugineum]
MIAIVVFALSACVGVVLAALEAPASADTRFVRVTSTTIIATGAVTVVVALAREAFG